MPSARPGRKPRRWGVPLRRTFQWLAALWLVAPCQSIAQPARSLTVAEARARARTLDAAAAMAEAREEWAAARALEARANRWPQVIASGRYARLSDVPAPTVAAPALGAVTLGQTVPNQAGVEAKVSIPLYTGSRLRNAQRSLEHAAHAAGGERDALQRQLEVAAETAYWRLYQARRGVEAVEETVRLVEAHRRDVERLERAGLAVADAVLEAEVRLSEARLRRLEARHGAALAQAALARVACLPLDTRIALTDTPSVQGEELAPVTDLRRQAVARRPDLAALAAAVTAADSRAAAVRGERLPSVSAQASWDLSHPNSRYFPLRREWHGSWLVGVGVRWNAWDAGGHKARRLQAEAELRQAEARLRQAREGVAHEVLQRRLAAIEAARRVALARQAVAQSAEHARLVRRRFEAGAALSTEALDAEVSLEGARLSLARALAEGSIARAEMALAIGATGEKPR